MTLWGLAGVGPADPTGHLGGERAGHQAGNRPPEPLRHHGRHRAGDGGRECFPIREHERAGEEPEGAAGRITRGVQRLGDEPKERLAGPLDFLGGLQVGGGLCYGVELLEGDARLQEAIGSGQRSELLVRGHDQLLGVLPAAAPVGLLDLDGEEAGPVMVEEGGEEVAQEGVGRWGQMLRDVAVPQPPADDVAVLGLHQRVVVRSPGPGLRELLDVQLVQHRRDPVVDVLRPVVGMEPQDAEGERAGERREHGDHEVLGDPGNDRKLLELRHFVDHVDHVDTVAKGRAGGRSRWFADPARAALLRDQPAQLGVRVAGDLGEELPHPALPSPRQAEVVAEPDQRPFNERVGRLPVVGGDVRRLVPAEEGADVVERPNPFGAECHDHAPMICSHPGSCSLPVGNRPRAHAHFSLDNAPR